VLGGHLTLLERLISDMLVLDRPFKLWGSN